MVASVSDALYRTVQRGGGLELRFLPDELYRAPTADGAAIALGRYHPRSERLHEEPVILCHGLGANRFNLDFDERHSLARYLARRGFETWVMELRGRGLAGASRDYVFDDQAEHDVAAALRTVRAAGARQVLWVGHSKGGLLLFAHLAKNPGAPVRAAVTMGTPGTLGGHGGLQQFIRTIGPVLRMKVIPTSRLSSAALLCAIPNPITRSLIEADNVEPDILRKATFNMPSDIAGGVARQFAQWIASGRFDSYGGGFDYGAALAGIRIPMLMLAGAKDALAPPQAVWKAKDLLGGPVQTVLLSKQAGFSADYGHGDLVLGRAAPDEVFPHIGDFLAAHSTRL